MLWGGTGPGTFEAHFSQNHFEILSKCGVIFCSYRSLFGPGLIEFGVPQILVVLVCPSLCLPSCHLLLSFCFLNSVGSLPTVAFLLLLCSLCLCTCCALECILHIQSFHPLFFCFTGSPILACTAIGRPHWLVPYPVQFRRWLECNIYPFK